MVEIHALVFVLVVLVDLGRSLGVVGICADRADDLARLVVVNNARALLSVGAQSVVGRGGSVRVDGQGDVVRGSQRLRHVKTPDKAVARELRAVLALHSRRDIQTVVAHSVEQTNADAVVLVVDAVGTLGFCQNRSVSVIYRARLFKTAVARDVGVVRLVSPVVGVENQLDAEERRAADKEQRKDKNQRAALQYSFHIYSLPLE